MPDPEPSDGEPPSNATYEVHGPAYFEIQSRFLDYVPDGRGRVAPAVPNNPIEIPIELHITGDPDNDPADRLETISEVAERLHIAGNVFKDIYYDDRVHPAADLRLSRQRELKHVDVGVTGVAFSKLANTVRIVIAHNKVVELVAELFRKAPEA